ncbi:hypothetical protein CLV51_103617 [Chitinophaga niastensis]|uniref:MORN repeat protein n=1 Tax=Chitinophaga niastensis TaxID=536980 RepID=A0A2P8HK90_CHINA|nr:hypothetical protein [Chitinophaga niastensis]PSL46636.1 hypothetical protein CLV51_103617 [Chitinophaga niastensis]
MRKLFLLIGISTQILVANAGCKQPHTEQSTTQQNNSDPAVVDTTAFRLKEVRAFKADNEKNEWWVNKQDSNYYIIKQYRNDILVSFTTYKNKVRNGYTLICYEDGKKMLEGMLVDGKKEGMWKGYDKKGNLASIRTLKADVILEERFLSKDSTDKQ